MLFFPSPLSPSNSTLFIPSGFFIVPSPIKLSLLPVYETIGKLAPTNALGPCDKFSIFSIFSSTLLTFIYPLDLFSSSSKTGFA